MERVFSRQFVERYYRRLLPRFHIVRSVNTPDNRKAMSLICDLYNQAAVSLIDLKIIHCVDYYCQHELIDNYYYMYSTSVRACVCVCMRVCLCVCVATAFRVCDLSGC